MAVMARPVLRRRRALSEVVHQCGKANRQRIIFLRGVVDHQHDMDAGIDFRMMQRRLRHAPQRIELGHEMRQRPACAQHRKHA